MAKTDNELAIICFGDYQAEFSAFTPGTYQFFATMVNGVSLTVTALTELIRTVRTSDELKGLPLALGTIQSFNQQPALYQQMSTLTPNIIYNTGQILAPAYADLLALTNALPVDFNNAIAIQTVLKHQLYQHQNGFRIKPSSWAVNPLFNGQIVHEGNIALTFRCDFNQQYGHQIISTRMNFLLLADEYFEFIPEYDVADGLQRDNVFFKITLFTAGTNDVVQQLTITAADLAKGFIFNTGPQNVNGFVAVYVSGGQGTLRLGQLHMRKSRLGAGEMLIGGHKIQDEQFQVAGELLYFMSPGDFKPPLNVYFAGYRTLEGFEAQRMMQRMGAPFLLIADSRLEGGGFYLGSPALEQGVVDIIRQAYERLNFTHDQVIMAGLSMGTFAACYYAADIQPAAVIIGKPLLNIGDVAGNERLNRPEAFPTSLDVLLNITGRTDQVGIAMLNQRFWDKFATGDFAQTKFLVSYMKQDDYDGNAFVQLNQYLKAHYPQLPIIHRGFIGRHNDDTPGIVASFLRHFSLVFKYDFKRSKASEG